ncbi:MAG: radical SAM protein [Candidatus Aenigmarchaeota archaeon]|nr:radical SAM protein [Candidatus Aenigmarchaeota archaeon]
MKILLANPPGLWLRCRWDIKLPKGAANYFPYPVRLAYATSVLKKHGYDAHIVDATASEMTRKEFLKKVREIKPDLIVWETTASSFEHDLKTMKMIKKFNSKIKFAASGYHATPAYNECVNAGYDFAIVGECEYSILGLVRWLNKEEKSFPAGVAAKGQKFRPRPLIQDLDELPWPERDELPMDKYNDPKLHGFNVVMITSRGCPWGCNFCTVETYYRQKSYRMRKDVNDIVNEMEYLWNKYKPDELYFDDDNFSINESHVKKICKELIRRKSKVKWNCMADAKISYNTLKIMRDAGCTGITIGAESADDKVLKQLEGKPITRKDIKEFVESCNKLGLRTHLCWVLGMKGSTKESDRETIEFAINLPSDTLQFSVCMPFPGTRLNKWCKDNDLFVETDWKNFIANTECVVDLPGYTHDQIKENLNLANKLWYRKMVTKRPDIIVFHFYNLYKYKGLKGAAKVLLNSVIKPKGN